MKKTLLLAAVTALFTLSSFKMPDEKGLAVVEQQQGYYIFVFCKPYKEYDYLGTIKAKSAGWTWSGEFRDALDITLKRLKKEYPKADGVIVYENKADAIRFK